MVGVIHHPPCGVYLLEGEVLRGFLLHYHPLVPRVQNQIPGSAYKAYVLPSSNTFITPIPHALSMKPRTYAEAGVDISREALSIKAMAEHLAGTLAHRAGKVGESLTGIGHFSALLKLSSTLALAINTDGVGSKLLVAEAAGRYDTVGIDLVAMNANDIICVGAEPVAMVDYLAVEEPEPEVAGEIA